MSADNSIQRVLFDYFCLSGHAKNGLLLDVRDTMIKDMLETVRLRPYHDGISLFHNCSSTSLPSRSLAIFSNHSDVIAIVTHVQILWRCYIR